MPLFNTFEPLPDSPLKEKIMAYAQSVNFPLSGIFVMDGSKRSTKSNAFFTGFGKNKRIALFDTLLENHTDEELLTILAHEIGHYKKRHILVGLIISIAHLGIVFFLLSIFLTHRGLYDAFFMAHMSTYAGLIFFGMLYSPIELVLSLIFNMLLRHNEREADRFAVETTGLKNAFITALKKLSAHNLSNLSPHPFQVLLHESHPPVLERIRVLKSI
jgi:STE24 endopeptidase